MSPIERAQIQRRILDGARTSVPGGRPTNGDLGNAAGCDRSEITRFEAGERKMDLDEVIALADRYGGEAVLGPIAELFGLQVAPVNTTGEQGAKDVARGAVYLSQASSTFGLAVHDAMADGLLTDAEADDLERRQAQLLADARRMLLRRVRAGRVA